MITLFVNWGQSRVMLTWKASTQLPDRVKITSVHGFCFYEEKLILVDLKQRGWDIPGGHIDLGEEPEACFKRETLEEAYVEGNCELIGYIIVDHSENPNWKESGIYPKVGYQVFYKMSVEKLHTFDAQYESTKRILIDSNLVSQYHHDWNSLYQEILDACMQLTVK